MAFQFDFLKEFQDQELEEQEDEIINEDEQEPKEPPFIFVTKINNFGTVIIGSSEPLEINFETIDSIDIGQILEFKVIEPNNTESMKLIANYTVVSLNPLTIQIAFENPLYIT